MPLDLNFGHHPTLNAVRGDNYSDTLTVVWAWASFWGKQFPVSLKQAIILESLYLP